MTTLKCTRVVLVASLAASAAAATGLAQQPRTDTTLSVTLPNTYVHVLRSRINGRAYRVQVALPSAYVGAKPGDVTRFRTLYLLDGNFNFSLLVANQQRAATAVPTRTIIVGVAAAAPADSQMYWRQVDYTPPLEAADSARYKAGNFSPPLLGGAPQFLRVLKEEIIPLIDRTYRTSGDRGIEGVSLSGLFVAYAMLEEPDLFTRYALLSPSLFYPWGRDMDMGMLLTREAGFAKAHPEFKKIVYVSVGSEEVPTMIAVAWEFVSQLCVAISEGNVKGLELGAETLPGQSHGSSESLLRGMTALYGDSTRVRFGRDVMQHCH